MDKDGLFLAAVAVLAVLFAVYNLVCTARNRRRAVYVTGTVVAVRTAIPETMRKNNSKWAAVSYRINGRSYISGTYVQVPMACQIGSRVRVCCNKENPEELYVFSFRRAGISFAVAAACIAAAVWKM